MMSSTRGDRRRLQKGGEYHQKESKCKQPKLNSDVNQNSPIIRQFLAYQKSLDGKHDKHERLVKLSRDITIESKRTIFLLHRTTGKEDEKDNILAEAEGKLNDIHTSKWSLICAELQGEDPYQYIKAYSSGLQEYIEAISFYHYLKHEKLISLEAIQETLVFLSSNNQSQSNTEGLETTIKSSQSLDGLQSCKTSSQSADRVSSGDQDSVQEPHDTDQSETKTKQMYIHIPPMEYMLGIGDLTGELMRVAINSIGTGDVKKPFELCNFLRCIHNNFMLFGNVNRELTRKMYTLRQSLQKVEAGCYTLQVRGSEIPKHMLADVFKNSDADTAGYCDDDTASV